MKKIALLLVLMFLLAGCSSKAPAIPHKVSQDTDCKTCHATGAQGAKVSKHINRPNCTQCHQPKS